MVHQSSKTICNKEEIMKLITQKNECMGAGLERGYIHKGINFKEKQVLPFYLANDHIFIHTVTTKNKSNIS